MKKIFISSAILYFICATASANTPAVDLSCPDHFPIRTPDIFQNLGTSYYMVGYYVDSKNPLDYITTTSFNVVADSFATATIRANQIATSGLIPAAKQATFVQKIGSFNEYYCSYISSKYNLSTLPPTQLTYPQRSADYLISIYQP